MAATPTSVNRAWFSIDTGSQNFSPKLSFFVGGDTPGEVIAAMGDLLGTEAADNAIQRFVKVALTENVEAEAVGTLRSGGLIGNNQPEAPANSPVCNHGSMVYKTGTSAKGPWKAWFCPAPKGDPSQCKAKFL